MVICFGISWPINIVKAWKARSTKGISLLFYSFILLGYLCALAGKCLLIAYHAPAPWYETARWYVMFFYVINTLMGRALRRPGADDPNGARPPRRRRKRNNALENAWFSRALS